MFKTAKTTNSGARHYRRALLCLVFAGLAAAAPAQADRGGSPRQGDGARHETQRGGHGNGGEARAAAAAQSRHGGKVLKVSPQGDSYNVRLLLPDGTVKSVTVDPGD